MKFVTDGVTDASQAKMVIAFYLRKGATMKLVIDLPQEEYEDILNGIEHARIAGVPIDILGQAIENGIPLDDIRSKMMYEIYMDGVNMANEYHGCWVRFKNIEKIVDKYIGER